MCLNTELYKKNVKILLTTVTSRAKLVKSQYELNLMPEIVEKYSQVSVADHWLIISPAFFHTYNLKPNRLKD